MLSFSHKLSYLKNLLICEIILHTKAHEPSIFLGMRMKNETKNDISSL